MFLLSKDPLLRMFKVLGYDLQLSLSYLQHFGHM